MPNDHKAVVAVPEYVLSEKPEYTVEPQNAAVERSDKRQCTEVHSDDNECLVKRANTCSHYHFSLPHMDLSLRLGLTLFSYLPVLIGRLSHTTPLTLHGVAMYPLAAGLELEHERMICLQPQSGEVVTTEDPSCFDWIRSKHRFFTLEDGVELLGMKSEKGEWLFEFQPEGDLIAVNNDGHDYVVPGDIIQGVYPDANNDDNPCFQHFAVSRKNVYLLMSDCLLTIALEELASAEMPVKRMRLSPVMGAPRDPIAEDDVMSFVRWRTICLMHNDRMMHWELPKSIVRHVRYKKLPNLITLVVMTTKAIVLRDFSPKELQWEGDSISIPRKKYDNGLPMLFIYKDVVIAEEDIGCFLAIDLKSRRTERFQCQFMSSSLSPFPFRMFNDNLGSFYLSLDETTWVFK